MTSYRILLDLISDILLARTKLYKILVIIYSSIGLISFITSILMISIMPLSGMLLLIPAYSFYLTCDHRKLNQWRYQILIAWKVKSIDISALSQAINSNKALPELTIHGMLDTLPTLNDLVEEQSITKATRQAAVIAILARDQVLYQNLLYKSILSTLLVIAIISAIFFETWIPILMLSALPILSLLFSALCSRKIAEAKKKLKACTHEIDFDKKKYNHIVKLTDWMDIAPFTL